MPECAQQFPDLSSYTGNAPKILWDYLSMLDQLEYKKIESGWTEVEQRCFYSSLNYAEKWNKEFKLKLNPDVWAFRSAIRHYLRNSAKRVEESTKTAMQTNNGKSHPVAAYYLALSLDPKKDQARVNKNLLEVSLSKDPDDFVAKLIKRSTHLLMRRLKGGELFKASKEWVKAFPERPDLWYTYFESALSIDNTKDARKAYDKLKTWDFSQASMTEIGLRARLLRAEGKIKEAFVQYKMLLEKNTFKSLAEKNKRREEFLELCVSREQWNELRLTLEPLLASDPTNDKFMKLYELAIYRGAYNKEYPIEDLRAALKSAPSSNFIKTKLALYLVNKFEKGEAAVPKDLLEEAAVYVNQLAQSSESKIDIGFMQAVIFYHKRVFTRAENQILPAIAQSKAKNAKYNTPLSDIYLLAAKIANARGDNVQARKMAREGISRVPLRKDKKPLQIFLQDL